MDRGGAGGGGGRYFRRGHVGGGNRGGGNRGRGGGRGTQRGGGTGSNGNRGGSDGGRGQRGVGGGGGGGGGRGGHRSGHGGRGDNRNNYPTGEKYEEGTVVPEDARDLVGEPITESKAGIECYLRPGVGFTAILKQRYTDFVVNEVAVDGTVCHITDIPFLGESGSGGSGGGSFGAGGGSGGAARSDAATGGETMNVEADGSEAGNGAAADAGPAAEEERKAAEEKERSQWAATFERIHAGVKALEPMLGESAAAVLEALLRRHLAPSKDMAADAAKSEAAAGSDGGSGSGSSAGGAPSGAGDGGCSTTPGGSGEGGDGSGKQDAKDYILLPPMADRMARARIHAALKEHLSDFASADTVDDEILEREANFAEHRRAKEAKQAARKQAYEARVKAAAEAAAAAGGAAAHKGLANAAPAAAADAGDAAAVAAESSGGGEANMDVVAESADVGSAAAAGAAAAAAAAAPAAARTAPAPSDAAAVKTKAATAESEPKAPLNKYVRIFVRLPGQGSNSAYRVFNGRGPYGSGGRGGWGDGSRGGRDGRGDSGAGGRGGRFHNVMREAWDWPADRPHYLKFALHKEHLDTNAALYRVAREAGTHINDIGYAGVKDRRGVTTQWCTVYKRRGEDLAMAINAIRPMRDPTRAPPRQQRKILVGNFEYVDKPLFLGDLRGNRFSIALRNVTVADLATATVAVPAKAAPAGAAVESEPGGQGEPAAATVKAAREASNGAAEAVKEVAAAEVPQPSDEEMEAAVNDACRRVAAGGFINYYGLQRFGTGSSSTADVGRAMLRGDFREAVELIMRPRDGEIPSAHAGRIAYLRDPTDVRKALNLLPAHLMGERNMLHALLRNGHDAYASALAAQPRNLQLMYLHAFQSLCFNHAASYRVETYGVAAPVAGDLVLAGSEAAAALAAAEAAEVAAGEAVIDMGVSAPRNAVRKISDTSEAAAAKNPAVTAAAAAAAADGAGAAAPQNGKAPAAASVGGGGSGGGGAGSGLPEVHVVTEEEAAAGTYSMRDVVLPLPGQLVKYPQNDTGTFIKEFMKSQGVTMECLGGSENPDYRLGGAYRRLLQWPENMTWAMKRYKDPLEQLLPNDLTPILGDELALPLTRVAAEAAATAAATAAPAAAPSPATAAAAAAATSVAVPAASAAAAPAAAATAEPSGLVALAGVVSAAAAEHAASKRGLSDKGAPSSGGLKRQRETVEEGGCASGSGGALSEKPFGMATAEEKAAVAADEEAAAATAGKEKGPQPFWALLLTFELPSSTYATMCIREVLKKTSSRGFHAAMNNDAAGAAGISSGGGGGSSGGGGDGGGSGGSSGPPPAKKARVPAQVVPGASIANLAFYSP